ncbi:MAG: carboxypeptidase-like regulatory domain-containing protein, partial [Planctomycetota bacterium]
YDVIVVGEVDSKFFDEQDIGAFRQFVSRGGGLILIDGPTDRLRELATFGWKDFFPIEFQGVRGRRQQASSFAITDVGRREGLMGIGNEKIDEWFSNPMRLPRSVRQTKLKADAEVWAEVKTDAQTLPLAVARSLGSGRILYLASDETWRFRFREADKIYGRFWTTIIEAMTPPPFLANTPYASLATDQLEYAAGDLVTVRARLRDPDGSPASGSAVEAIIESEDTTIRRVPMRLVDRERGQYEATIQGLDAANYSLRLSASGFRQDTLDVETPFWVSSSLSSELNEVGADVVTLKEITEATGGITLNESDADSILDRLKPLSAGRRITTDYPIWSSFPWFGAIMMLLTLEWLLRKKASLA